MLKFGKQVYDVIVNKKTSLTGISSPGEFLVISSKARQMNVSWLPL